MEYTGNQAQIALVAAGEEVLSIQVVERVCVLGSTEEEAAV